MISRSLVTNWTFKCRKLMTRVGGVGLLCAGAFLTITNPGQGDYEAYATEALTTYLKNEVCSKAPQELQGLLNSYCKLLVETGRPQFHRLISQQTMRRNFLLFSIYETQLSLPAPIPGYEFETLAILRNFYTYEADEL